MYDIFIIGGGPAGLTAAIYASRAGFKTALAEQTVFGGQMALTDDIENYPGIMHAAGYSLADSMHKQAKELGTEFLTACVQKIFDGTIKKVVTDTGTFETKAIIYAAGSEHRKLIVPGEEEFLGKGVSYCATCDGGFFRGKRAAVIGGGNSALKSAIYLSNICEKVYLIHRGSMFRGDRDKVERIKSSDNILLITDALLTDIRGKGHVESISVNVNGSVRTINTDSVFISVGMTPLTEPVKGICELDEQGYVIAGEDCITSAAGIFAAGDVRKKKVRQIITACSDGICAVTSAGDYLSLFDEK